jgi:hypothetical protein
MSRWWWENLGLLVNGGRYDAPLDTRYLCPDCQVDLAQVDGRMICPECDTVCVWTVPADWEPEPLPPIKYVFRNAGPTLCPRCCTTEYQPHMKGCPDAEGTK